MKRFLAIALALVGVSAGAANESAVQADRALNAAFAKGDSAVVNKLLDADFTWIDTDGIMRERSRPPRHAHRRQRCRHQFDDDDTTQVGHGAGTHAGESRGSEPSDSRRSSRALGPHVGLW